MSAPSSFQLNLAPESLHLPPSPPRRLKPEIYQSPDDFRSVDEHAIAVSLTFWKNYHIVLFCWTELQFIELCLSVCETSVYFSFYHSLAMLSAITAMIVSVRPSVCHVVFNIQQTQTYDHAVFTER